MVNLIEFTLKSDRGERFLFISPVLMQSKEMPSLLPPIKAYVYEDLIKEDFWAHLGDKKSEIPKEFERKELVIKHDQDFEKAYLGYLVLSDGESTLWQWEDNVTGLNKGDIEKIEAFLNNYKKNKN
ncbi:hypothetical protein G7092_20905 [Mucilaginibacter sp. HC2]|uniref:hypothetical protein n=1 Tax=Mucilaginibacter inviolabilis TaxID=2714892 RepID=UPI00140A65FF|nr:hypothetical protein [Mucilaginibacter inviolabilis]NHA06282.1 hypothetical protein [Mucilaginibacter inviolabilis]